MYQEFFSSKGVMMLPIIAMLLFCAVFSCAVAWTMWRGRRQHYDEMAKMPMQPETQGGGRHE